MVSGIVTFLIIYTIFQLNRRLFQNIVISEREIGQLSYSISATRKFTISKLKHILSQTSSGVRFYIFNLRSMNVPIRTSHGCAGKRVLIVS